MNGNDGKPALEWKNDAGAVWGLTLKEGGVLQTDDRNPYRKNQPNFYIELARNADGMPEARHGGFHFGNSVYKRVEAPRR